MSNEGSYIKANSINAGALAVGPNAQANSYGSPVQGADLGRNLAALRQALAGLELTDGQHASVARDVDGLKTALQADPPDKEVAGSHLKSITDKLDFAGKTVASIAELVEPIKAIAVGVGLSLKAFGLG